MPLPFVPRTHALVVLLTLTALLLGAYSSGAVASNPAPYWTDTEDGTAEIANGHWVLASSPYYLAIWNMASHQAHVAHLACSNDSWGMSPTAEAVEPGGTAYGTSEIAMTPAGTLYAVVSIGAQEHDFTLPSWNIVGDEPAGDTRICDAFGRAFDPNQTGEDWTNPFTEQKEVGFNVLITSSDDGASWHLAASTPDGSIMPHAVSNLFYRGADTLLLTSMATGVRLGNPSLGYATYAPDSGWSALTQEGSTFGYIYKVEPTFGSVEPGTVGPKRYLLTQTRRLSDGSVWALWQPQIMTHTGDPRRVKNPAVMTRTLNGRVLSRITAVPSFRVPTWAGGTLVSPGCVEPASAMATGIGMAVPSDDGRTIYASTVDVGPWRCHNKYINVNRIGVLVTLIVSHDGGRQWGRVMLPNLGAFTRVVEILAVDGTTPVVGFDSNRHPCDKNGGMLYERLSHGHWQSIGCRNT
jgi:hypothetical protein